MLKKILSIISIFAISLSIAYAGSFYFGPAVTYVNLKSNDSNYSGVSPAIYAGYGTWMRSWLYLAGEIFAAGKAMNVNKDDDSDTTLKTASNFGISVIPAVILDNALIGFARLGYVKTDFSKLSSDEGAYQIGAGIEGAIADCWSLRGEYVFTPYTSVPGVGTIHSNQVTVALIYRFESLQGSGNGFFEEYSTG